MKAFYVYLMVFILFSCAPNEDIFNAAKEDNIRPIQNAIDKQADITILNDEKKNILMIAAENGNVRTVKFLIQKKKFDINAKDKAGETALSLAIMNNKL